MVKKRKKKQGEIREKSSTTSTLHIKIGQEKSNMAE